jgi:hypothetical protein
MANFLPFKLLQKKEMDDFSFKGIMGSEDLHTDEQGRHLIFRTIRGKVIPMRVGAEDFAEWLVTQGVSVNPADQKTLRELDKELEIMERAAEYGGPALQKQYEDYFKERRQQYAQLALQYYQQALQNQAKKVGVTPEQAVQIKQQHIPTDTTPIRRESSERRGWGEALQSWVESQDRRGKLTPATDQWYYNRLYGVILHDLSLLAEKKVPLSAINLENILEDKFLKQALQHNYDMFFSNQGADHRKTVAAINTMRKNYKGNIKGDRKKIEEFIGYWYNKMLQDFSREEQGELTTSPVTEAIKELPENSIPKELPERINREEVVSLMGLYSSASGSKLNAAHRVMLHSLGRILESIPLSERVRAAVELSNGKTGINAVHREGYKRAYLEASSLGLVSDRDELVRNALDAISQASSGTTTQKISAIKKLALIMGTIDGLAVLGSNPGIQEAQFTKKWHDTAINAGRTRSEGPGLIDILMDDDKRKAHIYTNSDLKILHGPAFTAPAPEKTEVSEPEKTAEKKESEKPLKKPPKKQTDYTFSGSKIIFNNGYTGEFTPTNQGYLEVSLKSPDGLTSIGARVSSPPMKLSEMTEEDGESYIDSVVTQLKSLIPRKDRVVEEESVETPESGTFRIPLFDFSENLTNEDRDFLSEVIQHVDEGGLEVKKLMEGAYRVRNPANNKTFDILMNKAKKKLVGLAIDEDGKKVPFTELSIQDFTSAIDYRSSEEPVNVPIKYY